MPRGHESRGQGKRFLLGVGYLACHARGPGHHPLLHSHFDHPDLSIRWRLPAAAVPHAARRRRLCWRRLPLATCARLLAMRSARSTTTACLLGALAVLIVSFAPQERPGRVGNVKLRRVSWRHVGRQRVEAGVVGKPLTEEVVHEHRIVVEIHHRLVHGCCHPLSPRLGGLLYLRFGEGSAARPKGALH